MGLFTKEPTTQEKNDIRALLSRAQTCARNLNEADSISGFYKEWDKLMALFDRLIWYEKRGTRFKPSPRKNLREIEAKKEKAERDCIDRAFSVLQASLFSLKTESGRRNKVGRFFEEAEYYSSRMEPANVAFIREMKTKLMVDNAPKASEKASNASGEAFYCTQCGSRLRQGDRFCSKCGAKVE